MGAPGRLEIGLEPDRVEDRVGREPGRDLGPVGGRRVDPAEDVADGPGHLDVDDPSRSCAFQTGYSFGGRKVIAKAPAYSSSPRIAGTAPGTIPATVRNHATSYGFATPAPANRRPLSGERALA
jgi:hypothetical protein